MEAWLLGLLVFIVIALISLMIGACVWPSSACSLESAEQTTTQPCPSPRPVPMSHMLLPKRFSEDPSATKVRKLDSNTEGTTQVGERSSIVTHGGDTNYLQEAEASQYQSVQGAAAASASFGGLVGRGSAGVMKLDQAPLTATLPEAEDCNIPMEERGGDGRKKVPKYVAHKGPNKISAYIKKFDAE